MRIAHVIQSIDPRFGGPSAVVMRLARAQANLGASVSVVTVSSENERRCFDDWIARMGSSAAIELVLWPGGWLRNFRVDRLVRELFLRHDIVHIHGVWDSLVTRCLSARVRGGARIVLAPHGMLSTWSMRQKQAKKILAWKLWMRSALTRVDRFHVLNDAESLEVRALLPGARSALLPNGTDLPAARRSPSEKKHILFLARLHYMKGPDRLVDAFALCVQKSTVPPGTELVVAGPDFGMLTELRGRAAQLGVSHLVRFPGTVLGAEKDALLNGSIALCQPSRHEGFSLTLLEALAHGVPVIATPESNFPAISSAGCGLIVRGDETDGLASALTRIAAEPGLREKMSHAGRLLVEQHYTWEKIADRSLHVYQQCGGIASAADEASRLSTASTGA
jgi:glycosyltransferase involved in cell wall biosynthesis